MHDLWKKISISAITIVLLLGGMELAARAYQRKAIRDFPAVPENVDDFGTFDQWLDWALDMGQVRDYAAPFETNYVPFRVTALKPNYHLGLKNIDVTTNSLGFRADHDLVMPKPKNTFRVFILGGSTVEGIYNKEWTLDYWLQKDLQTTMKDREVEVINAGVGGYYSQNEIALLQTKIIDLEPDLVIIYDGFNDIQHGFNAGYESRGGTSYVGQKKLLDELVNYPTASSLLSYTAKTLGHESAFIKIVFRMLFRSAVPHTYPKEIVLNEDAVNIYLRNLKLMKATLETEGIKGLILFQPTLAYCKNNLSPYEQSIVRYLKDKEQTDWMDKAAKIWPRVGAMVEDLPDSGLVKTKDISCALKNDTGTDYIDSIHSAPEGNKNTAAVIADTIRQSWSLR